MMYVIRLRMGQSMDRPRDVKNQRRKSYRLLQAVYCYQPPDLRSQCFAFEGEKIMIKTAGCYLLTVCRDVGSARWVII